MLLVVCGLGVSYIEERSFVAALLWMTAKVRFGADGGFSTIFDVMSPTFLLSGSWFCNSFKNPAGHFAVDYSFVVGGFPLGDFGACGLDGEDRINVAGFEGADGQRSYFPFSCSSASERRT